MKFFPRLDGTSVSKFLLGLVNGVALKSASGALSIRNATDTADANLTAAKVSVSGQSLELNSDATAAGSDHKYTLTAPATGMTEAVTLVLPVTNGSPGQVLATDGDGNLSFTTVASDVSVTVDTTTVTFGSGSTVPCFTLPANAVVQSVAVIVDAAFDGTANLSVGTSAEASKYMAAGDSALGFAAGSVFEVNPGLIAVGTTEAIEVAFAAGGATTGSARIEVRYAVPA